MKLDVSHLTEGLRLPDIELQSSHGGQISLARLSGRNVVYIYPWTGRPGLPDPPDWDHIPGAHGSTPEAQGFRDLHAEFAVRAIGVYGISAQDTAYQREFSERLQLPFPLLSDERYALQQALALPTFRAGDVIFLKRLTLLITDGRLTRCLYPVTEPATHAAEVLAELQSAS